MQDIADDEIIGLKSTAIKFKKNIKLFVTACYLITFFLMIYVFEENLGSNLSTVFIFMFIITLAYQIKIFSARKPLNCLRAFRLNNLAGFFIFLSILTT